MGTPRVGFEGTNRSRLAWIQKSPTLPCNIAFLCRDLHHMPHSKNEQTVRTVRISNTCILFNVRAHSRQMQTGPHLCQAVSKGSHRSHALTTAQPFDLHSPRWTAAGQHQTLWSSSPAHSCLVEGNPFQGASPGRGEDENVEQPTAQQGLSQEFLQ